MKTKYLFGTLILFVIGILFFSFRNTSPKYKWKGNYVNEKGATLTIDDPKSDGFMKFELVQTTPNCSEGIHGTAKLDRPDIATYTEHDTLILTFMYKAKPEQVDVSEIGFTHGATCNPFNGTYKKKE
jgi:hypothetical protein